MAINKVVFRDRTIIDISDSTVTPETLGKDKIAYDADGEKIVGTMEASSEDTETLKALIDRTLVEFQFPENVDSIGSSAFANCSKLAITSLSQSITTIGGYAFQNCYYLALTSLPSNLTYIGKSAFVNCSRLRAITFTNNAENPGITIESNAFQNCTNLTTINVPWSEGGVANAPWGATNATINYNYVDGQI